MKRGDVGSQVGRRAGGTNGGHLARVDCVAKGLNLGDHSVHVEWGVPCAGDKNDVGFRHDCMRQWGGTVMSRGKEWQSKLDFGWRLDLVIGLPKREELRSLVEGKVL
jgi:hypothetical protein